MPQLSLKIARQQRKTRTLVILLLLVLGLALLYVVYQERERALAREGERLLTQVRVIDANLVQQLRGMNAAMDSVRQDPRALAAHGEPDSVGSMRLRALSDAMPGVRTMLITNVQGRVLASSRAEALGFDVSPRAYFRNVQSQPRVDTLYVSEPFKTALGVFSLNLVKTWSNAQNGFGGVVTATLDPEYFNVLMRSVLYANDMRVTVIHGQGKAFLTLPDNPAIEGINLATPGTVFTQHLASGLAESQHTTRVALTGDQRMVVYRTVRPGPLNMDQPLMLAVSRELGAVLAPWRELATAYGLTYGLVCAMVLAGMFVLQRQQQALTDLTRTRERETREHAERLDLALSGGDLGLVDMDLTTGVRHVNARAREIVGDDPADPEDTDTTWIARVHPDDQPMAQAKRTAHVLGETDGLFLDYRVRHRQGHWVWLHSRGRITERSADGVPLRWVGTYVDITERKAAEAQIAEFAFYDPLTHLPNRRLLMDRLAQAQHASARSRQAGAVMFLDLDRFKWVNDTAGHDMGDELLQQVAARLCQCVRNTDTVARLGGDEFVLVIQQLGEQQEEAPALAKALADKVLVALREPVALGEVQHTVTTSIGITIFLGETDAGTQLLKQADEALYRAKAQGRNSACIYAPGAL